MTDFDVIVVGARLAGASTAMLLARMGHRVLVLDRVAMPADTVSTHAITRTGVLQLHRWGLLDQVDAMTSPVRRITLGFGKERIDFDVRPEHGVDTFYAPRRHDLDWLLVRAALEAGAEFRNGVRVTDVTRSGPVVSGVVTDEAELTARLVVGADGVWSRVARSVGAVDVRSHEPRNEISYAYFRGIETDGFWFQFTEGVNAGLIPTSAGEVCVFAGRPTGDHSRFAADPDGEFERLLLRAGYDLFERVAEGQRVSEFKGTPGLPGFMRNSAGPGWALVGDAGYTKDPISAHGIGDALRDAELCARATDEYLRFEEPAALHRYQVTRDELSIVVYERSRILADYRWGPTAASKHMRAVSDAVRRECDLISELGQWQMTRRPISRVG